VSYFLAALTYAIAAQLTPQTKVKIVYGDEGFGRVVESGPHIQVLEDPSGDLFEVPPTIQSGSEPTRYRKWTGVLVKFKGASTKPGAKIADHRGVVEALADLFVVTLQEVAHSNKQKVQAIAGTTVDDYTDEVGTNPSSAYYQLRFQYCRALNKEKSLVALEGLLVGKAVIAHRLVVAPTPYATVTSVVTGVATVGGLSGIDASFVGKTLTLSGGSVAGNAGSFPIASVIDDATVTIANASAGVDTNLTWSVSDDEAAQED
jgi:hypothetical protein